MKLIEDLFDDIESPEQGFSEGDPIFFNGRITKIEGDTCYIKNISNYSSSTIQQKYPMMFSYAFAIIIDADEHEQDLRRIKTFNKINKIIFCGWNVNSECRLFIYSRSQNSTIDFLGMEIFLSNPSKYNFIRIYAENKLTIKNAKFNYNKVAFGWGPNSPNKSHLELKNCDFKKDTRFVNFSKNLTSFVGCTTKNLNFTLQNEALYDQIYTKYFDMNPYKSYIWDDSIENMPIPYNKDMIKIIYNIMDGSNPPVWCDCIDIYYTSKWGLESTHINICTKSKFKPKTKNLSKAVKIKDTNWCICNYKG